MVNILSESRISQYLEGILREMMLHKVRQRQTVQNGISFVFIYGEARGYRA